MKAVILKSDCTLHLEDIPMPKPTYGEVIIKVMACGICGSDLRYLEGENPWAQQTLGYKVDNPDNIILGHEFSGVVTDVHDECDRHLIGKRVAALVYKTCGVCEFCRTNRENLCRKTKHLGHGAGWEEMKYYPGGMAEYCQIWATHAYTFSDNISFEEASTLDFVSVALSAVKKAKSVFSEDCLIIGSGPVGLVIAQILKLMGARKVICVDIIDLSLAIAKQMGSDYVINSAREEMVEAVLNITEGLGLKNVFDTVGSVKTQKEAIKTLGSKGMLINLVCNSNEVEYELKDLSGERSITSVSNSPYRDFRQSIRMLEAGLINVKPLITHVLDIEDYQKGFGILSQREKSGAVKVILRPNK